MARARKKLDRTRDKMEVRPFTIAVADSVLEDLRQRLVDTRWPDEIPATEWDYGSTLAYRKELVE